MMLLEREDEAGHFDRLLDSASAGEGAALLIEGPVGSGKTTLLRFLTDRAAARGSTVVFLTAAAPEQENELGVVDRLLGAATGEALGATATVSRNEAVTRLSSLLTALGGGAQRAGGPLVIAVDDVHWADEGSRACVLEIVRRARAYHVVVLLGGASHAYSAHGMFRAELLREPHAGRRLLRPLQPASTASLLENELGLFVPGTDDLAAYADEAATLHTLSGGNPMLAHSLVEDLITARLAPEHTASPTPSVAFRCALLACLHKAGPEATGVARAIATLGKDATLELVVALSQYRRGMVESIVTSLEWAGILTGLAFRHPEGASAVYDDIPDDQRREAHRRAITQLQAASASSATLARHLVATDDPGDDPAGDEMRLLTEVARDHLRAGEADAATRCLDLAARCGGDASGHAMVDALRMAVRWRVNQETAIPLLHRLVPAVRAGHLPPAESVQVIRASVHLGFIKEAEELLVDLVSGSGNRPGGPGSAGSALRSTYDVLATTTPGLLARLGVSRPASAVDLDGHTRSATTTAAALRRVLASGPGDPAALEAEQALRIVPLDDAGGEAALLALNTLVYAERLDSAAAACDRLLAHAESSGATAWTASLAATRGEIAIRRGDPGSARHHAEHAIAAIGVRAWGIAVARPLSVALRAALALGRWGDAAADLDVRLPPSTFETVDGMQYLHARGQYHLARRQPHAAEADLRLCGELAEAWSMDSASFVPWRVDLAQARLQLGDREEAGALLAAHLERPGADTDRLRAAALRVRGSCAEPVARLRLLRESVELLQRCEERVELRRSLLALAATHRQLGEHKLAASMTSRAEALAAEIGVAPNDDTRATRAPIRPMTVAGDDLAQRTTASAPDPNALTSAEHRVAGLAALGHSNRAIAAKLFVTVSTVEQHLTRIYRKLGVGRREDLPLDVRLQSDVYGELTPDVTG
ncbi:helix-turn-helix transcriptional regulator [Paractinoplanes lichenicola]|uniref:AAA family ATPase n=1 Tax=Paractinoplanes lichenicola TaxID=2802976 RepID=A0ABS1W095_9ACTN|nr:helix-turn-helix transcriptional regulator [Actinoplanes lichenicola]MBL7260156.1 AAA family ATPase [Actinoplanes lichenicola]